MLVNGVFTEASRQEYVRVIAGLAAQAATPPPWPARRSRCWCRPKPRRCPRWTPPAHRHHLPRRCGCSIRSSPCGLDLLSLGSDGKPGKPQEQCTCTSSRPCRSPAASSGTSTDPSTPEERVSMGTVQAQANMSLDGYVAK